MSEDCSLCGERLGAVNVCRIAEKGVRGLVNASIARKDGKQEIFKDKKSLVVHASCRKNYTRPDSIAASLKREKSTQDIQLIPPSSPESLRSRQVQFQFKTKCFFCAEDIHGFIEKQKRRPPKFRDNVYEVRTQEMKQSVLDRANERGDKWGKEVSLRIINVNDLVAADALYHNTCCKNFFSTRGPTGKKRGRPIDDNVLIGMDEIYRYIDENEDCQFSFEELINQITGEKLSRQTIKAKLLERYGERILFAHRHSHNTILCFRDVGCKILNESWYISRRANEENERLRVVEAAAAIIKKDIQSQVYETDFYPRSDAFLENSEQLVPKTLSVFMASLINNKKGGTNKDKRKQLSISHAIIKAVRPRSFLSPILNSLALLIHRKFASKSLIQLLAALGFCSSYHDAQQLELSAVYHPDEPMPDGIFTQFVFDNADFNVATLDGLKTFHSMGGIKCITPARELISSHPIKKLSSVPPAETLVKHGVLQLETYENFKRSGLNYISVKDMSVVKALPDVPLPTMSDVLWFTGKWLEVEGIPEWLGYIRGMCNEPPQRSIVQPLPFINAPPSDYDTIYTALKFAAMQSNRLGMSH